jgi:hypothetical protein
MKAIDEVRSAHIIRIDFDDIFMSERYHKITSNVWEVTYENYTRNICGACCSDWIENKCSNNCSELPQIVSDVKVARALRTATLEGRFATVRK